MRQYNLLLEVPDDLDVTMRDESGNFLIGNDVAYEIYLLGAYWPALLTPGTIIDNPKKLMHCVIWTDIVDVETLVRSLIIGYSLDWVIVGLQSYGNDVPATYDVDGNLLTPEMAESIVPTNMVTAGKYLSNRYSEYEEDGTPIGDPLVKYPSWFHHYQGMATWR